MTSTPLIRFASVLAAVIALPGVASARDVVPQNNEVTFDVDATFAKRGQNQSDVSLVYTWLPEALDKNDEVVPPLRRFVRQPLELGARLGRASDRTDTITGVYGFGKVWLAELVYAGVDLGLEYDQVQNEDLKREIAFLGGSGRAEVGVRVLPLLQLAGFARYRPVLIGFPEDLLTGTQTERSGQTVDFGASIAFATPEDRLLGSASFGLRNVDWTFTGSLYPGDISGRAKFGSARLSLQLSPESSFFITGEVVSTDWTNHRAQQDIVTGRGTEGNVLDIRGDLGYVYWFEGRWGFRVSLGGGYFNKGPLFAQDVESGLVRLGIGFTSRY